MKSIWKLAGCSWRRSSFSPGSDRKTITSPSSEVVHGHHEHGTGRGRDRDAADAERPRSGEALVTGELEQLDLGLPVHGNAAGTSMARERAAVDEVDGQRDQAGPRAAAQPRGVRAFEGGERPRVASRGLPARRPSHSNPRE